MEDIVRNSVCADRHPRAGATKAFLQIYFIFAIYSSRMVQERDEGWRGKWSVDRWGFRCLMAVVSMWECFWWGRTAGVVYGLCAQCA